MYKGLLNLSHLSMSQPWYVRWSLHGWFLLACSLSRIFFSLYYAIHVPVCIPNQFLSVFTFWIGATLVLMKIVTNSVFSLQSSLIIQAGIIISFSIFLLPPNSPHLTESYFQFCQLKFYEVLQQNEGNWIYRQLFQ